MTRVDEQLGSETILNATLSCVWVVIQFCESLVTFCYRVGHKAALAAEKLSPQTLNNSDQLRLKQKR